MKDIEFNKNTYINIHFKSGIIKKLKLIIFKQGNYYIIRSHEFDLEAFSHFKFLLKHYFYNLFINDYLNYINTPDEWLSKGGLELKQKYMSIGEK